MIMSTLVLASPVLALTSCRDGAIREPSSTGDVHVTARALAAVSAEHLGKPSQAQVEQDPFGLGHPIAATSARYRTPSDDGDEVTVEVGTGLDRRMHMCRSEDSRGGCFSLNGVRVIWSPEIPEEDPGSIAVVAPREGGVYAVAGYSGTAITGDPRKLDLSLPLDDLIALARDARVDRTTTQAAVDGGANLDFWTFG